MTSREERGRRNHAYAWYRAASNYLSRGNAKMAHEMMRQGDRALDPQREIPEQFKERVVVYPVSEEGDVTDERKKERNTHILANRLSILRSCLRRLVEEGETVPDGTWSEGWLDVLEDASSVLSALSEQPQERVEGWSQGEPCPCGCGNWTIRTKQKSAVGSWNRRATLIIHDTPDSPEGESDE